ncbi:helix-turn-helix transcriptional regulator [Maribacter algicola]|uniref:Helix-turn-helix transcriptional regulator n=1 Tax=Meishania litoralis TaxID=3434685 RepID=A0ACC7LSS5_9FLAO
MFKVYLLAILLSCTSALYAQPAISGHLDLEDIQQKKLRIYLAKLDLEHLQDIKFAKQIAWAPIKDDGTFSFDRKHISEKDAIYRLYIGKIEKAIQDTIINGTTFILSDSDTLVFQKSDAPFENYSTTNQADKEWKKLQAFEAELLQSKIESNDEGAQLKGYAKDSLRILMVKLIGIKQLEEKQLLDQDIAKNPDFYLALLDELKHSEMPLENYRFLEKKLAFLTQEVVEQKYAWSRVINFILGFLVLGLGVLLVFKRKREANLPDLSRQERNVQNLMLQGKTNKEIAKELFISVSTVKTHITNIYGKLKVSNRQELLQKSQN